MSDPDRTPQDREHQTQTAQARERAPTLPSDHPDLRDLSGDEIRATGPAQRARDREAMTSWSVPRTSS